MFFPEPPVTRDAGGSAFSGALAVGVVDVTAPDALVEA